MPVIDKLNPYTLMGTTEPDKTLHTVGTYRTSNDVDDYTLEDFLAYFPEFIKLMKDSPLLEKTFEVYKNQAKTYFKDVVYKDDLIRVMGLHIAHKLFNTTKRIKNIDNELTLSSQNMSSTTGDAKGGKESKYIRRDTKKGENWDYYSTSPYGVELYGILRVYNKISVFGLR